jgi:heme/copper-type cytochrome/quinol oxidase subunit 1
MKTAFIFLALSILLLILFWWRFDIWFSDSTIDIHVHDTYYVIARWHAVLVIILFLGTFSSFGGMIGTRFRNKFFLITLIIFFVADIYIAWQAYSLINSG